MNRPVRGICGHAKLILFMNARKLFGGILVYGGLSTVGWGCSSPTHSEQPTFDFDSLNFALLDYDVFCSPLSEDMIKVSKKEMEGIIDFSGKEILPCANRSATSWEIIENYQKGDKIWLCDWESAHGEKLHSNRIFLDTLGVEYKFDTWYLNDRNFLVRTDTGWNILKRNGEMTPFNYDIDDLNIEDLYSEEPFIRIEKDGKQGLINRNWEEVIPCIYDELDYYREKISVKLGNLWGVIDKSGKIILPIEYHDILAMYGDVFWCAKNWTEADGPTDYVLLDSSGKELSDIYETIGGSLFVRNCYYLHKKNTSRPDLFNAYGKRISDGLSVCWKSLFVNDSFIRTGKNDKLIIREKEGDEYFCCIDTTGRRLFDYDAANPNNPEITAIYDSVYTVVLRENDYFIHPIYNFNNECIANYRIYGDNVQTAENLFQYNRFLDQRNGLYGLTNLRGNHVIPCAYDSIFILGGNSLVSGEKISDSV